MRSFVHRVVGCVLVWCAVMAHRLPAAESIGGEQPARAARSVHLRWSAPDSELFYLEAVVEQSTVGSYFMACGWDTGYFGIQEHQNRSVALFSVWDPTRGNDPDAVKAEDRVEVVYEGEGVWVRRFGNEGTGGQGMMSFPWHVGETNRFLVQAAVEGEKTSYAGYLYLPREQTWKHLVTFRTRTGGRPLSRLYSFVEDFRRDTKSAGEVRRARFGNGWVKTTTGKWLPLVEARFSASGANWEAKDTIDAGVNEETFFLVTGGDTKRSLELLSTLELKTVAEAPPTDLPKGQ